MQKAKLFLTEGGERERADQVVCSESRKVFLHQKGRSLQGGGTKKIKAVRVELEQDTTVSGKGRRKNEGAGKTCILKKEYRNEAPSSGRKMSERMGTQNHKRD